MSEGMGNCNYYVREKSGKSQGILRGMISGNPVLKDCRANSEDLDNAAPNSSKMEAASYGYTVCHD